MRQIRHRYLICFWLFAACLFVFPISNRPLRIAMVVLILGAYASIIFLCRRHKIVLSGIISLSILITAFLLLPDRNFETAKLRGAYLKSLRSYEGTRYVWGGENRLGIDCSGLVRAGLIKATFEQGLLTVNPELIRSSLSLWWHDCSAKALCEGYRGLTRHIITTPSINVLIETEILPGDIAVTTNGVHVLAYLGNGEWIEADPTIGKVVIVKTPSKDNVWFDEPVHIMRWTQLQTK